MARDNSSTSYSDFGVTSSDNDGEIEDPHLEEVIEYGPGASI